MYLQVKPPSILILPLERDLSDNTMSNLEKCYIQLLNKILLIPPIYTLTSVHGALNPVKIVRNVCVNIWLIRFCSAQSPASDP